MRRDSRGPRASLLLALLGALIVGGGSGSCEPEPPRFFTLVGVKEARGLLRQGDLTLVEVSSAPGPREERPGAVFWQMPDAPVSPPRPARVPGGGVLLVASRQPLGFRAAAALARAGNHPVYLCIPVDAAEKGSLYSLLSRREEIRRGRDSRRDRYQL